MPVKQQVYFGLGTNLGDRLSNLQQGLDLLRLKIEILRVSSVYETAPMYYTDQPAFLNSAASGTTDLLPEELLTFVKDVEREVGREPTFRMGPRVLDVDILLYGNMLLDQPNLSIPHLHLAERAFVLAPLAEIAPEAVFSRTGQKIEDLYGAIPHEGVIKTDLVLEIKR